MIKKTLKNTDSPNLWIRIVISLFKVEAFHRGKISFEDFQSYISDLSTIITDEKLTSKNHEVAFEVLEA